MTRSCAPGRDRLIARVRRTAVDAHARPARVLRRRCAPHVPRRDRLADADRLGDSLNTLEHVTLMSDALAPLRAAATVDVPMTREAAFGGAGLGPPGLNVPRFDAPVGEWSAEQVRAWVASVQGGRFSHVVLPAGLTGAGLLTLDGLRLSQLFEGAQRDARGEQEGASWVVSASRARGARAPAAAAGRRRRRGRSAAVCCPARRRRRAAAAPRARRPARSRALQGAAAAPGACARRSRGLKPCCVLRGPVVPCVGAGRARARVRPILPTVSACCAPVPPPPGLVRTVRYRAAFAALLDSTHHHKRKHELA